MIKGNPFYKQHNRRPGLFKTAMHNSRISDRNTIYKRYRNVKRRVSAFDNCEFRTQRNSLLGKIEKQILYTLLAKECQNKMKLHFSYNNDDFLNHTVTVYAIQEVSLLEDGSHGIGFNYKKSEDDGK